MTNNELLRLECLRLAIARANQDLELVFADAQSMYDWITQAGECGDADDDE
jgi:hypothetical protein